jgi:hypothetical protein
MHNINEKIVDKDNHAWDDCKYFFMMFFWGPEAAPKNDRLEYLRNADPLSWRIRKEEEAKYPVDGESVQSTLGDFE